jgi:hypothetical protein
MATAVGASQLAPAEDPTAIEFDSDGVPLRGLFFPPQTAIDKHHAW